MSDERIDYATIKTMAAQRGCQVTDLIALAPGNDPFYTGRPAEVAAAEWFAEVWRKYQRFEYGNRGRVRRVHYNLVGAPEPVRLPATLTWTVKKTGKSYSTDVYVNVDRCWEYLEAAGKYARYLSLVPADAFIDRRNPDALIFAQRSEWDATPGYEVEPGDLWAPTLPDLPELDELPEHPDAPDFAVYGYEDIEQPYHVEVWAEKSTQNDILQPVCQQWHVNLITGLGELSISSVRDFIERVHQAGKAARILYVSDYDPAGLGMPVSVARKIEWFQRDNGAADLDITLEPIILTAGQVAAYGLPRAPIKDSDARKSGWEELHGEGATELDALAALHPGEMERIVSDAILRYYDPGLTRRAVRVRRDLADYLAELRQGIVDGHGTDLAALQADYDTVRGDFEQTRRQFAELVQPFQARIDSYRDRLQDIGQRWEAVRGAMAERMREVDVDLDDFALPAADLPPAANDKLYASERDYFEQLAYYKSHRAGNGHGLAVLAGD